MKKIGTAKVFGKKKDIYGYNALRAVLIKVYANIANDYKEYDWQVYGVSEVEVDQKELDRQVCERERKANQKEFEDSLSGEQYGDGTKEILEVLDDYDQDRRA